MKTARLLFVSALLIVPTALFFSTAAPARAQDKPAAKEDPVERKKQKVRDLMAGMKTREIAEKSMDIALESAGAPPEYAQKFKDNFDFDGMIESTVGVYVKHLEEEDIDAMLKFYNSESGKKIAAAMKAGQEYGKRAAEALGGK
jgi:hypothetical protein